MQISTPLRTLLHELKFITTCTPAGTCESTDGTVRIRLHSVNVAACSFGSMLNFLNDVFNFTWHTILRFLATSRGAPAVGGVRIRKLAEVNPIFRRILQVLLFLCAVDKAGDVVYIYIYIYVC